MSRTRQMIELMPPVVFRETRPEKFTVTGFTCPVCNGNGWHWAAEGKDYVKEPCSSCKGTGTVSAEVTVSWHASEPCREPQGKMLERRLDHE